MSVFEIYYKGGGAKMMRPIHTRGEYVGRRNDDSQIVNVANIRKGNGQLKSRLVQMNYSCLPNEDGSLKGATRMSSTVGMDIDHIAPEELEGIKERILEKKDELGLLMLERSARGEGYHLVFRRKKELSQEENLQWASRLLGVTFDKGAKDITRVFFTTTGSDDDLIYLDDDIFNIEECSYTPPAEKQQPAKTPSAACSAQPAVVDDRVRFIVEGVMKEKGLVPSDFTDEGGRHTSVKMLLSGGAQLLSKAKANGVLAELMPEHWGDQNIQQLVNDFYANYSSPNQRLFKWQEDLFVQSRRLCRSDEFFAAQSGKAERSAQSEKNLSKQGEQVRAAAATQVSGIPAMPQKLPKLIQLLTSKTPDVYKATVAHAVFPPLATHLCGVRFTYTDNVEHEATLMNCLMAGTGTGKGCIDKPIDRIMADIRRRDKENEQREREWKKENNKRGDNKDKLVRPEGLVIQIIDSDMTKPALVTRMDEAEGHFVYVKLNELDLFEQLKGQTGKQHFQLMCLAFDPGAEYGQTRVGTQSVTAHPVCRFNWNACTTIIKGRRFFSKVLTDGPISRINFCTIPEEEIGEDQPVYGKYDAAFDEQLKPYIDNLVAARGLIDCPQAYKLAKQLQQECAEFARLSQDEVYWNLSHRACVIAWLKACVLYVANGQRWERSIEDFIRWSLQYDLQCKMAFFADDIYKANNGDGARIGTRGPRNLLELLPDEFSLDDARRVRQQQGLSNEGNKAILMIRTWVNRGYVIQNTEYSFKKSK